MFDVWRTIGKIENLHLVKKKDIVFYFSNMEMSSGDITCKTHLASKRRLFEINWIENMHSGADLDYVTYGLWRTKILTNCSKSFKNHGSSGSTWRTRKSFLNPSLAFEKKIHKPVFLRQPLKHKLLRHTNHKIVYCLFHIWK